MPITSNKWQDHCKSQQGFVLSKISVANVFYFSRFLLGRHKLAIEAYKQAELRSETTDWEIYHNLGVCYMYTKEMEPAKEHLTKALNFHKNDQSFITLGKILLLQGDINGAIGKVFLCFATIFFMAKTWLHTLTLK